MSTPSSLAASSLAYQRMKKILFSPFNLNRWFTIGFCAWLAMLGNNGSSGNFPSNSMSPEEMATFKEWLTNPLILSIIAGVIIFCLAIGIVFCWLRSRGDFMLLQRIYQPDETISACWRRSKDLGHSLFLWRIGFFAISCLTLILFGIIAYHTFFATLLTPGFQWDISLLPIALTLLMVLLLILMTIHLVIILLWDFVVPIMYWGGLPTTKAWAPVITLCSQHPIAVTIYFLLMAVWWLVAAITILFLAFGTCCIGFLLLIIPYIGTVALLPMYIFFRAYPIYFLAQWRPDLIPTPEALETPPTPTATEASPYNLTP